MQAIGSKMALVFTAVALLVTQDAVGAEQSDTSTGQALDCKGWTLDGSTFAEAFHAIAAHGTLQDIPFIERTFRTQLVNYPPYPTNPHGLETYRAASILDAPIALELYIITDQNSQRQNNEIAFLRLTWPTQARCMRLLRSDVDSRFAGNKIDFGLPHAGGIDRIWNLPGANGSMVRAVYIVPTVNGNIVDGPVWPSVISQHPRNPITVIMP
jgi:hypothetical protein